MADEEEEQDRSARIEELEAEVDVLKELIVQMLLERYGMGRM